MSAVPCSLYLLIVFELAAPIVENNMSGQANTHAVRVSTGRN